jgi:hypothetical protein
LNITKDSISYVYQSYGGDGITELYFDEVGLCHVGNTAKITSVGVVCRYLNEAIQEAAEFKSDRRRVVGCVSVDGKPGYAQVEISCRIGQGGYNDHKGEL